MTGKVKKINNLKKFAKKNTEATNVGLERACVDFLTIMKPKMPKKKGFLRASARYEKVKDLHFIIRVGHEGPSKAYARFQEAGGDGERVVKNYSEAGTGAHFMRDTGKTIKKNFKDYIISESRKVRV